MPAILHTDAGLGELSSDGNPPREFHLNERGRKGNEGYIN